MMRLVNTCILDPGSLRRPRMYFMVSDWLATYTDLELYIHACTTEEQLLMLARHMAEAAAQSGVIIDPQEVFLALSAK